MIAKICMLSFTLLAIGSIVMAQTEGQVRADGVVLHYKIFGTGAPILLLSGGPGIANDYFTPLAKALGETYQTILLDQRGTGKSQLAAIDLTTINFETYLNDLEAVRKHLKVERWTLLGHSWGGILAMAYAAKHPQQVKAMILAGSGGINTDFVKYYTANILSRLSPAEREEVQFWQEPQRFMANPNRAVCEFSRIIAPAMVFDRKHAYALAEQTLATDAFNPAVNLVMNQQWFTNPYDFKEPLRQLHAPVLIVQGRQDPIGETTAYQIQQTIPNAKLQFVEQCGHWAFVEHEQEFLQIVRDFLKNLP
ncbi:MAG: alpha/beta fold hydrolase [bacterium]